MKSIEIQIDRRLGMSLAESHYRILLMGSPDSYLTKNYIFEQDKYFELRCMLQMQLLRAMIFRLRQPLSNNLKRTYERRKTNQPIGSR